ncbi:MAG: hypothetical protein ACR2OC_00680 [Solirubrobacterales bacterium]
MSSYSAAKAARTIAGAGGAARRLGLVSDMRGKRISRDAALRIGAIALVALAAVAFAPGLLSPPDPPPLAADIGLGATGANGLSGLIAEREPREGGAGRLRARRDTEANGISERARGEREIERPRRPKRADLDKPPAKPPKPAAPTSAPPPQPAAPAAPVYVAPAPAPAPAPPPAAAPPPGEFGP